MGNRPSNTDVMGTPTNIHAPTQLGPTPHRMNSENRNSQPPRSWRSGGVTTDLDFTSRQTDSDRQRISLAREVNHSRSSASLDCSQHENYSSIFNGSTPNMWIQDQTRASSSNVETPDCHTPARTVLQRMPSLQQDSAVIRRTRGTGSNGIRRLPSATISLDLGSVNNNSSSSTARYEGADDMEQMFRSMGITDPSDAQGSSGRRNRLGGTSSNATVSHMPYSRIFERLGRSNINNTAAVPANSSRRSNVRCHQPNRDNINPTSSTHVVAPASRNSTIQSSAQNVQSMVASVGSLASNSSSSSSNSVAGIDAPQTSAPQLPTRDGSRYRHRYSSHRNQPATSSDNPRSGRNRPSHRGAPSNTTDINAESFSMMMLMAAAASQNQEQGQSSQSQRRSSLRRWWRRHTSPSTSPEDDDDEVADFEMDDELPIFISWMRNLPMLQTTSGGRSGYSILIPSSFHQADKSCPICQKMVPYEDYDLHYVMCLTKPKLEYKEELLEQDKGECAICLEDLSIGCKIARLPCHCVYHTVCIDLWFKKKQDCPMHPAE